MPIRILIADDNQPVRSALSERLKSEGWEVLEAANGKEAVAQAMAMKPDLAILDLVMPQMDGLTASRKINELLPTLPILMYTMHYSKLLEIEASKFGVRKMVDKPDTKLLLASIRSLLTQDLATDTSLKLNTATDTDQAIRTATAEVRDASISAEAEPNVPGDSPE